MEEIRLFNGPAPGTGKAAFKEEEFFEKQKSGRDKHIVQNVSIPRLVPFFPEKESGEKMPAMVVIPGGSFRRLVYNFEGEEIARWLNSLGIAAFVLKTRLPVNEHERPEDVALIDAQRAIRLIRSRAGAWKIAPDKVGVMGFSAGGYMAALVASGFGKPVYEPADEIDRESARPDFAVCGYPAVSLEEERKALMDAEHLPALPHLPDYITGMLTKYNIEAMITQETPPLFIMDTDDDKVTPPENSIALYMAARKAGVTAELHIFRTGGHGYGLGSDQFQTGQWRGLFAKWLESISVL